MCLTGDLHHGTMARTTTRTIATMHPRRPSMTTGIIPGVAPKEACMPRFTKTRHPCWVNPLDIMADPRTAQIMFRQVARTVIAPAIIW